MTIEIEMPLRNTHPIKVFFEQCQAMNNDYLRRAMPSSECSPTQLETAMNYSVFNGGKRFRPSLLYATAKALGIDYERAHSSAAAIELIHAYSLVHDDLPAMDNDELRRGKPTCHVAFGEANAILAGDALQTLAFEILASDEDYVPDPSMRIELIRILANACGTNGMAGGQALDLQCENTPIDSKTMERIHHLKTGRLIEAAVEMGAVIARSSPTERTALQQYAEHLGLAFQIQDDILDVVGTTEGLGKPSGSDQARKKATYPAIFGLKASQQLAKEAITQCHSALKTLPKPCKQLHLLANFVIDRQA